MFWLCVAWKQHCTNNLKKSILYFVNSEQHWVCWVLQTCVSKAHCLFCFRIMDAKSFYSKRKVFVPARSIPNPEVSDESDLSSDSDESDSVLESYLVSETEE